MKLFHKKPTLRFACYIGGFYVINPPIESRALFPEWAKSQDDRKKFASCPGMMDMSKEGFIIRSWADIHIKANSAGTIIDVDTKGRDVNQLKAVSMDYDTVKGLAPIRDDVKPVAMKCPSPWAVFSKEGYSAYVLPAYMHSKFLDKIYVYSGIVDYEDFHTINFIFSPLEKCEFTIRAGEPLLQVIPFKREVMTAEYGPATRYETDKAYYGYPSKMKNYYRKYFHKKKIFSISSKGEGLNG